MRKLIHNDRGETLIEVLASVLIATLSVTLLFGCVTTASKLDTDAKALDGGYYAGLTEADVQVKSTKPEATPVPTGTVTIERVEGNTVKASAAPTIEIYGDADVGVYSYKRK